MYEAKITSHQFSRQSDGAEEKVTEGEVEHQQGVDHAVALPLLPHAQEVRHHPQAGPNPDRAHVVLHVPRCVVQREARWPRTVLEAAADDTATGGAWCTMPWGTRWAGKHWHSCDAPPTICSEQLNPQHANTYGGGNESDQQPSQARAGWL